jgi:hypothetical protein
MKNGQGHVSGSSTRSRKTKADSRAQIQPAAAPELGFNALLLEQAIGAGPSGIRKAQHVALKFAKKYQEEAIDHFMKVTAFLQCWIDKGDSHYRARARFALVWRPRFLAALSMTNSVTLAARRARISRQAIYEHRKADAEFADQWDEAVEHAIDMLHARAFQRALEGDVEPVYYMGEPVGYIRKFSDKLQIELLRAWKPDRFKTAGVNVNLGTRGDVFVLTEEQRAELRAINREWLLTSPLPESRSGTAQPQSLTNGSEGEPPAAGREAEASGPPAQRAAMMRRDARGSQRQPSCSSPRNA